MTLDSWGDLAFGVFAMGMLLLSGMFLLSTRWYRTPVGRSIGGFFIAITVTMTWSFIRVFDLVPLTAYGIEVLRLCIYGILGISTWGMVIGFVLAQYLRRTPSEPIASRNTDRRGNIP